MSERETMQYDVITVGAGPAGLAFAIRLKQLKPDLSVCVIEKASTIGAQILSGAVIEPGPLNELLPEWGANPPPICVPAAKDEFWWLRDHVRATKLPIVPPQMNNHGNFIVSLGALCAWLAPQAEALGVDVFPGFAAAEAIFDDAGAVKGVRIGDMGVARDGSHKPGYTEGIDIVAPITVLGEGCRGSISKQLIARYKLDADSDPQTYGIGLKELWQLPAGRGEPGKIVHTLGWPLDPSIYGGSFLYHLDKDRVAIGFVAGLDYADPEFKPFEAFQQLKNHALIKPLLEGGEILSAGARALIEGGYQSLPKVEMPGAMLIGDSAGLMNVPKIKGTHQAMRSGMLAAEHLAETGKAAGWDVRLRGSVVMKELRKVRNIRPGFNKGLWFGLANAGWETATAGLSPWTLKNHADHSSLHKVGTCETPDRDWTERSLPPRDRLASVYFAATEHDEDQPIHLKVADT
ncbi:MAG: NAD(P)/FAD-dependent oxidoreductase, partial [Dokdonella sp.]|uniref:NAD(P)-binding protein n=1 Tax=Dokdonella sp. TaxID=2291710 RepID=UPI003BAE9A59